MILCVVYLKYFRRFPRHHGYWFLVHLLCQGHSACNWRLGRESDLLEKRCAKEISENLTRPDKNSGRAMKYNLKKKLEINRYCPFFRSSL